MNEKLVFAQTFEGLLRALQGRITPAIAAELKARGLDTSKALLPAYPHTIFVEVASYLARSMDPGAEQQAALTSLGRAFMDGYFETFVGRALLPVVRMLGPRRTLERLSRQFRSGNNFSETKLEALGATEYHLWINEVRMPGWYIGLMSRGLELSGAKGVKVELIRHDATGGTFRIAW